MSPTEQMALNRWIEYRDPEAFRSIVSAYSGMVYGICRRIVGDATEAEDITQECFEALACATKPPGGYLGPWLHRVATNLALKHRLSDSRRKRRETTFQADVQVTYKDVRWDDVFAYVDQAIAELPEQYRDPIVWHFMEDQSHAAIAESLNVSRQTVTYRIGRGVELIRKSLKRKGIPTISSSLVALLAANLNADAAPPALVATLGKLALAGIDIGMATGTAGGFLGSFAGIFASASKVGMGVLCTLLLAVAGIATYSWQGTGEWRTSNNETSDRKPEADNRMLATDNQKPETGDPKPDTRNPIPEIGKGPGHIFGPIYAGAKGDTPLSSPAEVLLERLDWDLTEMPPAQPALLESRSSADGQIDLRGIDYGIYVLMIKHGENVGIDWVSLGPGDLEASDVNRLLPGGVFRGRVVDPSGRGMAGAVVYPFPEFGDWSQNGAVNESRFAAGRRVLTQADGTFVLDKAFATTRRLLAKVPGFAPTFSGAVHPGEAPVDLMLETGGSVSGQVIHAGNRHPLSGIRVFVRGRVIQDSRMCKTDASGQYHADLLQAGGYTVGVFDREYISMDEPVKVEVQTDRETEAPSLTAVPGGVFEGRVFNAETSEGIPGFALPFDFYKQLVPIDPIVTDGLGHYRVPGILIDARVSVVFADTPGYWIAPAFREQWFSIRPPARYLGVDFALHPTRTIVGKVVDLGDHPVSAARVRLFTLTGDTLAQTTSDAEGRFSIEGLVGDTPSCIMAETDIQTSPQAGLTEFPDKGNLEITLRLQTGYPVAGHLMDACNHVLDGWLIKAESLDQPDLEYSPTETDAAGAFRFPAFLPGLYALLVAPPRTAFQGNEECLRIQVGPGAHNEHVILTYDQGLSISGLVFDSDGPHMKDALVECSGPTDSTTTTDENGGYALRGLAEGAYAIRVTPSDGACCMGRQDNVAAGSVHVDFHLQPRQECRGYVRRADDLQPVTNFEAAVVPGTVSYVPAARLHPSHQGAFTSFASREGTFTMPFSLDLGPNTVIVRAAGYATAFVPVDLQEGAPNPDLDILLEPGGELHGWVRDPAGQFVAGARVFIGPLPDPANYERAVAARSGADGGFALSQVPAGAITLTCLAKGYPPCARRVNTAEDAEVTFVLSAGASLEGFVRVGAEAVANATVSIFSVDESVREGEPHSMMQSTRSRADGLYSFTNLPDGEMQVEVGLWETGKQARPVRGVTHRINLGAGAATHLDVDFPVATAALGGHVTVDGTPAENAVVTLEVTTRAGDERVNVIVLPDGSWVADPVPAGRAHLTVRAYNQEGRSYRTTRDLVIVEGEPVQVEVAFPEAQPVVERSALTGTAIR